MILDSDFDIRTDFTNISKYFECMRLFVDSVNEQVVNNQHPLHVQFKYDGNGHAVELFDKIELLQLFTSCMYSNSTKERLYEHALMVVVSNPSVYTYGPDLIEPRDYTDYTCTDNKITFSFYLSDIWAHKLLLKDPDNPEPIDQNKLRVMDIIVNLIPYSSLHDTNTISTLTDRDIERITASILFYRNSKIDYHIFDSCIKQIEETFHGPNAVFTRKWSIDGYNK